MRTSKTERKENAKRFYINFRNSISDKITIVVNRKESANPNLSVCEFVAVPTQTSLGTPVVIARSNLGIEGCFIELLNNINPLRQKTYYEDGFNEWLLETFGFGITYFDGLVFILEKNCTNV